MDVLTVVVGVFAYFLFMWLFRGLFVLFLVRVLSSLKSRGEGALKDLKKEMGKDASMSDVRNDEKQKGDGI
jgi:hypothetical protein